MSKYLEGLADDPAITVYEAISGTFLKRGQLLEENPDAETVTLDSIKDIRIFREIMESRRKLQIVVT